MPTFILLNISDFEFVGYKYKDPSLLTKTSFQKRGKDKARVYYYLPSGEPFDHYRVKNYKSVKEKAIYVAEFNIALQNGYLPKRGADYLRKNGFDPKDGKFPLFFDSYFNLYSVEDRKKGAMAIKSQKIISRSIVEYFEKRNIFSICEITDDDIKRWDQDLLFTPKKRGKGFLSPATRNGRRKVFRAFLNTAKENGYSLRCNPSGMNIFEYGKGGKIDTSVDARKVIYPFDLIDAVQNCSYQFDATLTPDMAKIIRFWKEMGLRPGEMFNLSEYNFIFENNRPKKLKIMTLAGAPNGDILEFAPKNEASTRELPLSNWGIEYVESLFQRFKGIKRYGAYKGQFVEFPFFFVFWDEKEQKFIRNDAEFQKRFTEITDHAIKEFNLPYQNIYVPYDLRRSCNLYLKTFLKYDTNASARFLGHSKATNLKHYTLTEDLININQQQIDKANLIASKSIPEVAAAYSEQFDDGVTVHRKTSNYPVKRFESPDIELESASSSRVSSLEQDFIVMREDHDAD